MSDRKKGDIKEEGYNPTDISRHKYNEVGSGGADEAAGEQFYARGATLEDMALLEDTRFLSEALEVIFLLMEACDPKYPGDRGKDGLTNEELEERMRKARIFLNAHEKRALIPSVKASIRSTYGSENDRQD
jgi:hypothetical protein